MTTPAADRVSVEIVPDFDAFAAELRVGVDQAMRRLVNDVERALRDVERGAQTAADEVGDDFARGGERAEDSFRELARSANRSLDSIDNDVTVTANRIGGAGRSSMVGALLAASAATAALGAAAAVGLGALAFFGLKAAGDLEQSAIAFESLLGSADKAASTLAGLQKFAAATPFEFPQLVDVAKRFLAFNDAVGIADQQLIPFLTTVGNLASVTGGGALAMDRVALALGQIASKGKLSLEELNQISESLPGFSAIGAIAAARGISTAEAMEQISAGSINARDGVNALLKGMQQFPGVAGAMEKQSATLLGVFSTFKDTLSQALVGGFTPVIPAIKASLSEVTPILESAIKDLAPLLGEAFSALLPFLGQLVQGIVPILAPIVGIVGDILGQLGPILKPLGTAIGQVIEQLIPLAPLFGDLLVQAVASFIPVLEQLAPQLPPLVEAFGELLIALTPLIPILVEFLTSPTGVDSISGLVTVINALTSAINFLMGLNLGEIWNSITEGVTSAVQSVLGFFSRLPGQVGAFLSSLPGVLASAAVAAFDAFTFAVGFGIGLVLKFFIELPGKVAALVGQVVAFFAALPGRVAAIVVTLWATVRALFTSGRDRAVQVVSELPGKIVDFIKSIPGKITALVPQLLSAGFNLAKAIIDGMINGVGSLVGGVTDALKRGVGNALSGVKAALGIGSPSKVFADEVGQQIPAGIAMGIRMGVPELQSLLAQATSGLRWDPRPASPIIRGPGGLVTINVGGVHFSGVVPTEAEARKAGAAVAAGAAQELARRDIVTAAGQL